MIALPVKVTTSSVPNSYVPPTDMQGVLTAIPQFTTYQLNDSGAVVSINASGGSDLNGIWIWMLNQYKLPPRVMTGYRNGWWQVYTGKPQEFKMFMGAPAGYFDSSGRGIEYSGWEGWQLANGQNGSLPLANIFIVPAYRFDGNGWITNVEGFDSYNSGGETRLFNIAVQDLPLVSVYLNGTDFFKWARGGIGQLWSVKDPSIEHSGFNQTAWTYPLDHLEQYQNVPVSKLPPYIAVGYVQFMGYL